MHALWSGGSTAEAIQVKTLVKSQGAMTVDKMLTKRKKEIGRIASILEGRKFAGYEMQDVA